MAQLPETVNALTGIDLNEVIKGFNKKSEESQGDKEQ